MSDLRQQGEGERLPWLEPAEDYEDEPGPSIFRLAAAVVVALVVIGLIVGGIFWLRNRHMTGGEGAIIAAPTGAYKEKPTEAGGMKVEGTGDVAYGASEGKDTNSTIDLSALPEAPIAGPGAGGSVTSSDAAAGAKTVQEAAKAAQAAQAAQTAQASAKAKPETHVSAAITPAKPAAPKVAAPAPVKEPEAIKAAPTGGTIQLGALASEAQANKAWSSLSSRFSFLKAFNHSVMRAEVNGKTYYRLRADAGSGASNTCARLKVAGEVCAVVRD